MLNLVSKKVEKLHYQINKYTKYKYIQCLCLSMDVEMHSMYSDLPPNLLNKKRKGQMNKKKKSGSSWLS